MVKSRKNDAVCAPAPDEKSGKKDNRNAEDDIDDAAKKQKTARENVVPVKDDHSKVKKELPPKKEPAKKKEKSRKRQRSSASKVEPGSICDEDNEAKTRSSSSAATPLPNSLFVANLSGHVTKRKLKNFFEDVGEIIGIKFDTFDDGSSKGFACVQFATSEAVEKARMFNGRLLMGQHVKLNYGHEQRMINPDSSTFKKPGDFSKNTVLIKGFDSAYDEDLMAGFLEVHFDQCECADGGFTRISFEKDKVSGASEGVAFMEFSHPNCMPIALSLDGTVLNGFTLQVEEAKHVEGAEPSSTLPVTSTTLATKLPVTSAEGSTVSATMPPVHYSTPSTGKRIVFSEEDD